jgi:dihydroorotase
VLVDEEESWTVDADRMRSRGSNTPFAGRTFWGKIMMTIHGGTIIYDGEKQHV